MFDPKCLELAEHFLLSSNDERIKIALAEHIQEAVEIYLCGLSPGPQAAVLNQLVHCDASLPAAHQPDATLQRGSIDVPDPT